MVVVHALTGKMGEAGRGFGESTYETPHQLFIWGRTSRMQPNGMFGGTMLSETSSRCLLRQLGREPG